ncbi:MAG TPA: hypothetical protein VF627_11615 [Abditibacterium sp.]
MKKSHPLAILAALFAISAAVPAEAQVFDMGALTNTLSSDHNTQSERARARRLRSSGRLRTSRRSTRNTRRVTYRRTRYVQPTRRPRSHRPVIYNYMRPSRPRVSSFSSAPSRANLSPYLRGR